MMVGRVLVMMVPSRAETRPVIMRETMMAQKRQVRIIVGLTEAVWVGNASCIVDCVSNGEESTVSVCADVLFSEGGSSCVAILVSQMRLIGDLSV
jgi:hypothetical protein